MLILIINFTKEEWSQVVVTAFFFFIRVVVTAYPLLTENIYDMKFQGTAINAVSTTYGVVLMGDANPVNTKTTTGAF